MRGALRSVPDISAMGTVVIRHTCDGRLIREDYERRQRVFKDSRGNYYVRILSYKQPVTRFEGTDRFLLHYAGVSPRELSKHGEETS